MVDIELADKDAYEAVKRRDLIIVVDVLRCSSSIINALANGAHAVIPTETLKEAYKLREQNPRFLLAGERSGRRPEGFDLGNSPLEFVRETVEGKTVIMTTTSGTAALVRCRKAEHVLVGSFLNARAVAQKAQDIAHKKNVNASFVLAGQKGLFSLEDFLCAGAIASKLPAGRCELSDKASAAVFAFERVKGALCEHVMRSRHARHLVKLEFKRDVAFSCKLDHFDIVPVFRHGRVTLIQ